MRDLAFIAFLIALFGFGFRRPFVFVLTYVYIDIVSPQRLTYLLLNSVPISLIAVIAAVGAWAMFDDKRDTRLAPRQFLLLLMLIYCAITTRSADFPVDAMGKWDWVWKALAFAIFLPLTLRTKLRIEALLLFMVLSAGSIVIVGGIKTLASGGGYGELNLMVSNNSGLYEGSIISTVAVCIVPLVLWFATYGTIFKPDWKVKIFCYALAFACLLIPVGTSARTGLVCIGLLAALMLRNAKRRLMYLALVAVVPIVSLPFLPESFLERMQTIQNHQSDTSASTRVAMWQWTWDRTNSHPMGGGFGIWRASEIVYEVKNRSGDGSNSAEGTKKIKDGAKVRLHNGGVYAGDRRLVHGVERSDEEIADLAHFLAHQ